MQFLHECKTILPPPAYITVHTVLIAVKMNIISEEDADKSILYMLSPYTTLLERYNAIMQASACRNKMTYSLDNAMDDDISVYLQQK